MPGFAGLMEIEGLGMPAVRSDVVEYANRHGGKNYTRFLSPRTVSLNGRVYGNSDADVMTTLHAIQSAMLPGATVVCRLQRPPFDMERFTARVNSGMDITVSPRMPLVSYYQIQLLAEDPRIFSDVQYTQEYSPTGTTASGGLTFPLVFPLSFPTTTSNQMSVVNQGNFPTSPIITLRGPVERPIIANETNGTQFVFTANLGSTDLVHIDVHNRSTRLNGTERKDILDGTQTRGININPGTNVLRVFGTGMSANTLLTIQHRHARI